MSGDRHALLIATGSYDDQSLRRLRSPVQDAVGLAAVLGDAEIGAFEVRQLVDEPSYVVAQELERFFRGRSRDDLLLIHLSCHGVKDEDGQLYFATVNTDRELPASTAVSASFLQAQMDRCRAKSIVLMLDCCYSGSFLAGAKGDDDVRIQDALAGSGRAVLTATNRTEYAWEGETLATVVPQPSQFTGAVIDGLRSGRADVNRDGHVSVTDLYEYVYETLRHNAARQTPRMWAELEYQVIIAKAVRPLPPRPDGELWHAPRKRVRRGQDALIRLELPLEETMAGKIAEIAVDTAAVCGICEGRGYGLRSGTRVCEVCNATGAAPGRFEEYCEPCDGTGHVFIDPCRNCRGACRERIRRRLTFKVPHGVDNGTRIQLAGEGEVGPGGGPPGDLFIEVVELPHKIFHRELDDLHTTVTVNAKAAAKGGRLPLAHPDGAMDVPILPGTTDGLRMKFSGKGVPHLRDPGAGDLYITFEVR